MWYVGVTKSGTWLKYIIQIQKRNYVLCLKKKKGIFYVCICKIHTLTCLYLGYNVKALSTIEDANVMFVMLHLIGFNSSLRGNSTYSGTSLFDTSQQQYIVNFLRQKYIV